MIYTHAIAALLGASIAAIGAYKVQDWRYTGQIESMKAEQSAALKAAESTARAREQILNDENAKVTNAYLAQKARADAAAGRAAAAGRVLSEALAAAATADQNAGPHCGADDPRGTIAGECAEALRALDGYAQRMATKAGALREYAGSVCMRP